MRMIRILYILAFLFTANCQAKPIKESSCEIDLDGDEKVDLAFLEKNADKVQLVVKLSKSAAPQTLSQDVGGMKLYCQKGNKVKETLAGDSKGRVFKTPGAYIELVMPEASSVAYFWNGNKFEEVWTSD